MYIYSKKKKKKYEFVREVRGMLTREYFEKNSAIWCILKRILFNFKVKYLKNIDIHSNNYEKSCDHV